MEITSSTVVAEAGKENTRRRTIGRV